MCDNTVATHTQLDRTDRATRKINLSFIISAKGDCRITKFYVVYLEHRCLLLFRERSCTDALLTVKPMEGSMDSAGAKLSDYFTDMDGRGTKSPTNKQKLTSSLGLIRP